MDNWFECKLSYDKIDAAEGMPLKVKESYLVDALSFTEAEARTTEECSPLSQGEFSVTDIKRARLNEIFFNPSGDRYYKAKLMFIELGEGEKEKRTAVQMLAQASSLEEALDVIKAGMKTSAADYVVASIMETQIMDVFPFSSESKTTRAVMLEDSDNDIEA